MAAAFPLLLLPGQSWSALQVDPEEIDFGPREVQYETRREVQLTNTGAESVILLEMEVDGSPAFTVELPEAGLPHTIAAGGSVTVEVVHRAIRSDTGEQEATVTLSGQGDGGSSSEAILSLSARAMAKLPDFGVMLNEDGDFISMSLDMEESRQMLRDMLRSVEGTDIRTITHSVGGGSDTLYYDTQVASRWGWRPLDEWYETTDGQEFIRDTYYFRKAALDAGRDLIRDAGEEIKEMDLFFIPSYRMNDSHFAAHADRSPFTGEFYFDNLDKRMGVAPVPEYTPYENQLDFAHEEVRAYRFGVPLEVIERYGDIMDGVELDFRPPIFFKNGAEAQEHKDEITRWVRTVREALDAKSDEEGRPLYLIARVPPAPHNAEWAGLDVETWLKERLIDVLVPSQHMTASWDMPIGAYVDHAEGTGARVYPALFPRFQRTWPIKRNPSASDYTPFAPAANLPEFVHASALNYLDMGAHGFQVFNYNLPPTAEDRETFRRLRHRNPWRDRSYGITPSYWHDHNDTYEYSKQIPASVADGETITLQVLVGEDLTDPDTPSPNFTALRIGFGTEEMTTGANLRIRFNGLTLHDGIAGTRLMSVARSGYGSFYFLQNTLAASTIEKGWNTVEVTYRQESGQPPAVDVSEVVVGAIYPFAPNTPTELAADVERIEFERISGYADNEQRVNLRNTGTPSAQLEVISVSIEPPGAPFDIVEGARWLPANLNGAERISLVIAAHPDKNSGEGTLVLEYRVGLEEKTESIPLDFEESDEPDNAGINWSVY